MFAKSLLRYLEVSRLGWVSRDIQLQLNGGAMVYSYLSYGVVLWGSSASAGRAFLLQKRIIRLIFKLNYHESCRECRFPKEPDSYFAVTLYCLYIDALLWREGRGLRSEWQRLGDNHGYETRSAIRMHLSVEFDKTKLKLNREYNCSIYNKQKCHHVHSSNHFSCHKL